MFLICGTFREARTDVESSPLVSLFGERAGIVCFVTILVRKLVAACDSGGRWQHSSTSLKDRGGVAWAVVSFGKVATSGIGLSKERDPNRRFLFCTFGFVMKLDAQRDSPWGSLAHARRWKLLWWKWTLSNLPQRWSHLVSRRQRRLVEMF